MKLKNQAPDQNDMNLDSHQIDLTFIAHDAYKKDTTDYLEAWQLSNRRQILELNN